MITAGNHSRREKTPADGENFTITLRPKAPFRLDLTAWVLRRRPENRIDRWDGQTYRRTLALGPGRRVVEASVVQVRGGRAPAIELSVANGHAIDDRIAEKASSTIGAILGIDTNLLPFYRMASRDPRLDTFTRPFIGLKPPRFRTVFEALINGIACQQLSLAVGITLLNRLALACGPRVVKDGEPGFPAPEDIVALGVGDLREMGFNRRKAATVLDAARAVVAGDLDLEVFHEMEDAEAVERLQELKGVGRWTADYVLLRGLGRLSVFPGGDVGAKGKLERWLKPPGRLDYDDVRKITAKWHPYAGFVYFHLLLDELAKKGYIHG